MKKIKIISFLILLSSQLFSQNTLDTICHSFAGNIHFEFDYYTSKIINKDTFEFPEKEIVINKNEFLVVDLYDDCKCVKNQDFIKKRKIVVYFINGEIEHYENNSGNTTLHFDGSKINKVKFFKRNLNDIKRS